MRRQAQNRCWEERSRDYLGGDVESSETVKPKCCGAISDGRGILSSSGEKMR